MQVILIVIPAISLIFAAFGGQMGEMTSAVLAKSGEAVELVISLCGVICLWSGIMRVAQRAGILEKPEVYDKNAAKVQSGQSSAQVIRQI